MQIVFQDPYASLNPRLPIGEIIGEGLANMGVKDSRQREERVAAILDKVGLRRYYINRYPHEFSGGQRQRIGLARALVLQPKFVVADEPVSALDVSIQSQVLNLMADLKDELQLTYLFISHNLSVVQHISDRVGVMYLGKLVELASTEELFNNPSHPYTRFLLSAIPKPDPRQHRQRLILTGDVPSPINPPSGCRFHTRCPIAQFPICSEQLPPFELKSDGHWAACHFAEKTKLLDKVSGEVAPAIETAGDDVKAYAAQEVVAEEPEDVLETERDAEGERHRKEPLGGE
jgi:oligopeptide/dipeptide ABC transporter ATP-binding protein